MIVKSIALIIINMLPTYRVSEVRCKFKRGNNWKFISTGLINKYTTRTKLIKYTVQDGWKNIFNINNIKQANNINTTMIFTLENPSPKISIRL